MIRLFPKSNTATGVNALVSNTEGHDNTATGVDALGSNTTSTDNTATGVGALFSNTEGIANKADGDGALYFSTTGVVNTAIEVAALYKNTSGYGNTATGGAALAENTTGHNNTATGGNALYFYRTGIHNTATGNEALHFSTTGSSNTATGYNALLNNTTGNQNIAVGVGAGQNLIAVDNNIDIGNEGVVGEANTIRIGTQGTQTATYIAGVSGAGVMGSAVKVNAAGQIGTAPSSLRFKRNIKRMGETSDALFALRPVTFRYKEEIDPEGIQQFGLVAEEVEKVNPDLVIRDADGKPYTVRYEAVDAVLLNEFLEEHTRVEKLEATVAPQQKQINALIAGLQNMNVQLETSRPAPGMVSNGR